MQDVHVKNCHSGDLTLRIIREKFWIVHVRSLVRKVLFDCHNCDRKTVLPKSPLTSKLPTEGLSVVNHPFAHTGTDYFEPLLVKLNMKPRANQAVAKRYGAIFKYLSSRTLHIEMAGDLSTDSLI